MSRVRVWGIAMPRRSQPPTSVRSSWAPPHRTRDEARRAALDRAEWRCAVCGSPPVLIDVSSPWDGYAYVPGAGCGDESRHWCTITTLACLGMEVPE
jgi:hypothetical protein